MLDDLFRKTKAAPCIYWLPLTESQVSTAPPSCGPDPGPGLRRGEEEGEPESAEEGHRESAGGHKAGTLELVGLRSCLVAKLLSMD